MVYETPDQMSAVKKLSLRMSIKSPFGRKSSKKTPVLEENLYMDGDGAVTALPSPTDQDSGPIQTPRKGSGQSETDFKTQPTSSKGTSGKSYKWPFRNRRSEDNGSTRNHGPLLNRSLSTPTTTSSEAAMNDEPGSSVENNADLMKLKEAVGEPHDSGTNVCDDADKQITGPPQDTGDKHQFHRRIKGEGYVAPLRCQQELLADKKMKEIPSDNVQEVNSNGFHDRSDVEEGHSEWDGSSRDMNGNPQCSPPPTVDNGRTIPKEHKDTLQQQSSMMRPPVQLPPSLKESEPELPPRIPPKPASLRNRHLNSLDPFASCNGYSNDPDDDDEPPRPPARPRNRALGKGSVILHKNVYCQPQDNRATVYETISLFPKEPSLAKELAKLPRQPWYWGPLTQVQAEEKLVKLPDGYFLVRDSSDDHYLLSLSFNSHGRTLHTRIEYRNGLFSLNDSDGHTSVVELIACAVKESRSGVYGYMRDALGVQSFPARLTNWVSRFTEMRSLQHLCRFLIREIYPRHHILMLPLPTKIKEYILENQY